MKPVLLAIFALIIYAFNNVLTEQKLAKYSVFSLMTYFYILMLPLAIGGWFYLKATHHPTPAPSGWTIIFVMGVGVTYFIADSCYIGAYTNGGTVLTVAGIVALFPALASVIRYIWVGGLPNMYQTVGYILGLLAIVLIAKGSIMNISK